MTLTTVGSYSVAENAHPGYDATFSADCTGTIALGETKTCTVTNNDQAAHLIINKVVINNNGGALTAADFSGTIGGAVMAAGGNTWTGASTTPTLTAVGATAWPRTRTRDTPQRSRRTAPARLRWARPRPAR